MQNAFRCVTNTRNLPRRYIFYKEWRTNSYNNRHIFKICTGIYFTEQEHTTHQKEIITLYKSLWKAKANSDRSGKSNHNHRNKRKPC